MLDWQAESIKASADKTSRKKFRKAMNLSFVNSHGSPRIYDVQISRRVLNGEKELFHLLVQPYCRILHETVGSLFQRPQTIEEIILKTYSYAFANLYQFYGQISFRTWMISIGLHECRRSPDWREAVQGFDCTQAMTDDQKLMVLLYKTAGMSEREISYCLGGNSESVREQLKPLRDLIKKGILRIPEPGRAGPSPEALIRSFMRTHQSNKDVRSPLTTNPDVPRQSEKDAIPHIKEEHLSNLMLCSRIRAGFTKGVEMDRIKTYADWYWNHHLLTHFQSEEKMIFPILGGNHILVKKALREHRRLRRHFESRQDIHRMLNRIEEELEAHVRFEETVLFKEIEKTGDLHALNTIEALHQGSDANNASWQDRFWE